MTSLHFNINTFNFKAINEFKSQFNFTDAYFYYKQWRQYYNKFSKTYDFTDLATYQMLGESTIILIFFTHDDIHFKNEESYVYYYRSYNEQNAVWLIPFNFSSKEIIYCDGVKNLSKSANGQGFAVLAIANQIISPLYEKFDNDPFEQPVSLLVNGKFVNNIPPNPAQLVNIILTFPNTSAINFPARNITAIEWFGLPTSNTQRTFAGPNTNEILVYQLPMESVSDNSSQYTYPIDYMFNEFENNLRPLNQKCSFYTEITMQNVSAIGTSSTVIGNSILTIGDVVNPLPIYPICFSKITTISLIQNYYFDGVNLIYNTNYSCYYSTIPNLNPSSPTQNFIIRFPKVFKDTKRIFWINYWTRYSSGVPFVLVPSNFDNIGYQTYYNFLNSDLITPFVYIIPECLFITAKFFFGNTLRIDDLNICSSEFPMIIEDPSINYSSYSYSNMTHNDNLESSMTVSTLTGESNSNPKGNLDWTNIYWRNANPFTRRYTNYTINALKDVCFSGDDTLTNGMRSVKTSNNLVLNTRIIPDLTISMLNIPLVFQQNTATYKFELTHISNIPYRYATCMFDVPAYQHVNKKIYPLFGLAIYSDMIKTENYQNQPFCISSAERFFYIRKNITPICNNNIYTITIKTDVDMTGINLIWNLFLFLFI